MSELNQDRVDWMINKINLGTLSKEDRNRFLQINQACQLMGAEHVSKSAKRDLEDLAKKTFRRRRGPEHQPQQ